MALGCYRDKKGKEHTGHLADTFNDDDELVFIRNIHSVLLTRGCSGPMCMPGPGLRERLQLYLP